MATNINSVVNSHFYKKCGCEASGEYKEVIKKREKKRKKVVSPMELNTNDKL